MPKDLLWLSDILGDLHQVAETAGLKDTSDQLEVVVMTLERELRYGTDTATKPLPTHRSSATAQ